MDDIETVFGDRQSIDHPGIFQFGMVAGRTRPTLMPFLSSDKHYGAR
jgi:hypothetical protein